MDKSYNCKTFCIDSYCCWRNRDIVASWPSERYNVRCTLPNITSKCNSFAYFSFNFWRNNGNLKYAWTYNSKIIITYTKSYIWQYVSFTLDCINIYIVTSLGVGIGGFRVVVGGGVKSIQCRSSHDLPLSSWSTTSPGPGGRYGQSSSPSQRWTLNRKYVNIELSINKHDRNIPWHQN